MISDFVKTPRHDDVSIVRLYVMRIGFLLNFVGLGVAVWPAVLHPSAPIEVYRGVALAFWCALSTLSALGIRYPLKLLPMLITQLFYKVVWVLAVGVPLRHAGHMDANAAEMWRTFVGGMIMDVIVIPWPYVWRNYVIARGDRWKGTGPAIRT